MQNKTGKEKIFITGAGIVSALGNSLDETYTALLEQKINATKIQCPDTYDCSDTSENFAPDEYLKTDEYFKTDINKLVFKADIKSFSKKNPIADKNSPMRTKQLADIAFREAFTMSGLAVDQSDFKIGVCAGTTVASQLNNIEFYKNLRHGEVNSYDPVKVYLESNIAEALVKEHSFTGPGLNVVNACSSSTDAIGVALSWLNSDLCDIVIAGGADELNHVPFAGFNSLGIFSNTICSPFDKNRDGLNLGEGAAFLVLEKESSALKRNAKVLAQCCSYSTSADAHHLTTPRPDGAGLKMAVKNALINAALEEKDISFINAHGTATKNNDLVEGKVFKEMFSTGFGETCKSGKACKTKVLSTKGYTGHTLGAAGAIDAVLTILSLKNQWLPKSAGFTTQDPEIGFSPVTESVSLNADYALSTSLAFGGINSAVIFRRV